MTIDEANKNAEWLGRLIEARIKEMNAKQKGLAAEYCERKKARGQDPPSIDTVESRLSNLKKGHLTGVRYFFERPQDESDLLDVLKVSDEARESILTAATAALKPEDRRPVLAIDLSDRRETGGAFTGVCERIAFAWDRLNGRCVLVVTHLQAQWLVAKFSSDAQKVRVVGDADEGAIVLRELADAGVTIASARPVLPLERWIALDWESSARAAHRANTPQSLFNPAGSIEALYASRPIDLPDPRAAKRPASRIATEEPDVRAEIPSEWVGSPARMRSLMVALRDGEQNVGAPERNYYGRTGERTRITLGVRRAWGRALGLEDVAATTGEWLEALRRRAGALDPSMIAPYDSISLEGHRRRVAHGGQSRAVVAGDALHLLNPSNAVRDELEGLEGVVIEIIEHRPCELTELRALLRERHPGVLFDDPTAGTIRAQMLAGGASPDALDLAALLESNEYTCTPSSALRDDWFGAFKDAVLTRMGSQGVPVALRVPRTLAGGLLHCGPDGAATPYFAPPRVRRDEASRWAPAVVDASTDNRTPALVSARSVSVEGFLVLFDALRSPEGQDGTRRRLARKSSIEWGVESTALGAGAAGRGTIPLEFVSGFWSSIDREVATLFLALRRAVERARLVLVSTERALLTLDRGLVAEVQQWPRGTTTGPNELEIDVYAVPHRESTSLRIDMESVLIGPVPGPVPASRYSLRSERTVLRTVYIAHRTARFALEFFADPWAP